MGSGASKQQPPQPVPTKQRREIVPSFASDTLSSNIILVSSLSGFGKSTLLMNKKDSKEIFPSAFSYVTFMAQSFSVTKPTSHENIHLALAEIIKTSKKNVIIDQIENFTAIKEDEDLKWLTQSLEPIPKVKVFVTVLPWPQRTTELIICRSAVSTEIYNVPALTTLEAEEIFKSEIQNMV